MQLANRGPLLCLALFLRAAAQGQFVWTDDRNGHMEFREGGKPALVYNYGMQLKSDAPESKKPCCYLFPVYTPAGVSMLDDFPQDHWHHRGLFWAWPVVETGGRTYDSWKDLTAKARNLKIPSVSASPKEAKLEVSNMWQAQGKDIIRENLVLRVMAAKGGARELDLELTLSAVGEAVTLKGSHEPGKSYGGISARFAPRTGTVLRADGETLTRDEDRNRHIWAELEGTYGGRRAVLRITPDGNNATTPYQWCLRTYGFVGASWPGRTETSDGVTLEPGRPLKLKFRLTLTDVP